MKFMAFCGRNTKEILRDPLTVGFGVAFPVVLIILLTLINSNIPNAPENLFNINRLAPGMCIFGLSFVSLFSGMLISKDRSSSFLMRLYTSPLTPTDFILGYTVPLIPFCIVQSLLCMVLGVVLGMEFSAGFFVTLLVLMPSNLLFIAIGLWTGSVFNDKQVGGMCGALLTNLTAWLSGIWFDVDLVGGVFKTIAELLPFVHAVDAVEAANSGNYSEIFPDLWWVIGYAVVLLALSVMTFKRSMTKDA